MELEEEVIASLAGRSIRRAVWDSREDEAFLFLDDDRVVQFRALGGWDGEGYVLVHVVDPKTLPKRQRLLLELHAVEAR